MFIAPSGGNPGTLPRIGFMGGKGGGVGKEASIEGICASIPPKDGMPGIATSIGSTGGNSGNGGSLPSILGIFALMVGIIGDPTTGIIIGGMLNRVKEHAVTGQS